MSTTPETEPVSEAQRRAKEAAERNRSRRQQRRERLKPRLVVTTDSDGWTLTVPPPSLVLTMRWVIIATTAICVGLLLALVDVVPALLVLLIGASLSSFTFLASEPTTRIRVMRDHTSSIVRRGRRTALTVPADKASVLIGYDDITALANFEWSPTGLRFERLGKQDLALLMEFCNAAQVVFTFIKTSDKVDGLSAWRETINR